LCWCTQARSSPSFQPGWTQKHHLQSYLKNNEKLEDKVVIFTMSFVGFNLLYRTSETTSTIRLWRAGNLWISNTWRVKHELDYIRERQGLLELRSATEAKLYW
jgi:hypothetical protein